MLSYWISGIQYNKTILSTGSALQYTVIFVYTKKKQINQSSLSPFDLCCKDLKVHENKN